MSDITKASALPRSELNLLAQSLAIATAKNRSRLTFEQDLNFQFKICNWLDDCFLKIVSACNVEALVECGAHEASASSRFMYNGGTRAIAIEANPVTYIHQTKAAEVSGVTTLNRGVGIEKGELDFFIPENDIMAADTSFLTNVAEDSQQYLIVKIPMDRLDDLLAEFVPPHESLALWIDVEGMSLEVLKGGISLLRSGRCSILKIEVETTILWKGQGLVRDVDKLLCELSYLPVLRDIASDGQYNLIYVHGDSLAKVDELLGECWRAVAIMKLDFRERYIGFSNHLADLKYKLMNSNSHMVVNATHRLAAMLGSKSSQKFLRRL